MKIFLSIFFVLITVNFSAAKALKIDVRAGKTTGIYQFALYNADNCYASQPPKPGKMKAENGTITVKRSRFELPKTRCKGLSVQSWAIIYTPNKGFKGKDKAYVKFHWPRYVDGSGNNSKKLKFLITVK